MEKENLKKITALLVHVAKVDENYSEKEKSIIKNFIVSLLSLFLTMIKTVKIFCKKRKS